MRIPETEYARAGKVRIAYQAFGSGPAEAISLGGPAGHVELAWEEPLVRRWFERLASFARVATFDRRGTGASDPADGPLTIEQHVEDLLAVADACGFARPALCAGGEGAWTCCLCAAEYPDRVSALLLNDMVIRGSDVLTPDAIAAISDVIENSWGKGQLVVGIYAPSMAEDERFLRWAARFERNSITARAAGELIQILYDTDVSSALPRIKAPALVFHHRDNPFFPLELGRAAAAAIPNARFVEVAGKDSMIWASQSAELILDEYEEFLTGARSRGSADRVLATVLFTDIVGSTELAARLSDRRWRDLLTQHDEMARREIELAQGRIVKHLGDGVVATFQGPGHAIRAARSIIDGGRALSVRIRAGIHAGELELLGDDIGGMAVHIGARVSALAPVERILVTGTVKDIMVGSGLRFQPHGVHQLKGVPDEWSLYLVADDDRAEPAAAEPTAGEPAASEPGSASPSVAARPPPS